jgi:hypothetical protein
MYSRSFLVRHRIADLGRSAARRLALGLVSTAFLAAASAPFAYAGDDPPGEQTSAVGRVPAVHVQPAASEFTPPHRPDISASEAKEVDDLYRELTRRDPDPPPSRNLRPTDALR